MALVQKVGTHSDTHKQILLFTFISPFQSGSHLMCELHQNLLYNYIITVYCQNLMEPTATYHRHPSQPAPSPLFVSEGGRHGRPAVTPSGSRAPSSTRLIRPAERRSGSAGVEGEEPGRKNPGEKRCYMFVSKPRALKKVVMEGGCFHGENHGEALKLPIRSVFFR